MIKILYILAHWLRRHGDTRPDEVSNDPFSHPEIRAMRLHELADLPFVTMRENRPD